MYFIIIMLFIDIFLMYFNEFPFFLMNSLYDADLFFCSTKYVYCCLIDSGTKEDNFLYIL